jgi:hypothetical protein
MIPVSSRASNYLSMVAERKSSRSTLKGGSMAGLTNKTALITGASRGIGRATVSALRLLSEL